MTVAALVDALAGEVIGPSIEVRLATSFVDAYGPHVLMSE
jgi:hypothetical protein